MYRLATVFGLTSAQPTPQGLSGAPKFNENGVLLIHIEYDNNLKPYLEIKEAINNIADIKPLEERFNQIAPKDWRQRLVSMDQYSILEDIDSLHYIHPLQ